MQLLIDVRTREEFEEGHYTSAINVPVDEILEGNIKTLEGTPKDAEIKVYCRGGIRAERARVALAQLGFTSVTNIGGFTGN